MSGKNYKTFVDTYVYETPKIVNAHIVWVDSTQINPEKPGPVPGQTVHMWEMDETAFLIYRQLMLLSGYVPTYFWHTTKDLFPMGDVKTAKYVAEWKSLPAPHNIQKIIKSYERKRDKRRK